MKHRDNEELLKKRKKKEKKKKIQEIQKNEHNGEGFQRDSNCHQLFPKPVVYFYND